MEADLHIQYVPIMHTQNTPVDPASMGSMMGLPSQRPAMPLELWNWKELSFIVMKRPYRPFSELTNPAGLVKDPASANL